MAIFVAELIQPLRESANDTTEKKVSDYDRYQQTFFRRLDPA